METASFCNFSNMSGIVRVEAAAEIILRKRVGSCRLTCSNWAPWGPNDIIGIDGSICFQNLTSTPVLTTYLCDTYMSLCVREGG